MFNGSVVRIQVSVGNLDVESCKRSLFFLRVPGPLKHICFFLLAAQLLLSFLRNDFFRCCRVQDVPVFNRI